MNIFLYITLDQELLKQKEEERQKKVAEKRSIELRKKKE